MGVSTYKTKKGIRYRYKFQHDGTEYQKGSFLTSKDAKKEEAVHRTKLDSRSNSDILFNDLVDDYLADAKVRVSKSTINTITRTIKSKISGKITNKKINSVSPLDIRRWQNDLLNDGLSDTYVKNVNSILLSIFNFATVFYRLDENPCKKMKKIGSSKRDKEVSIFWTLEEFNRYCPMIKKEMLRIAVQTLFYTGMRIGELRALTWGDFDEDESIVNINKTIARGNQGEYVSKTKTKKSTRDVAIPQVLKKILTDWKVKQYKPKKNEIIFPFSSSTLSESMRRLEEETDFKRIRVHDLRHSHASMLVEMGVNIFEISQRLGHEDIQTTINTYSHLYPNSQKELAQNIDNYLETGIKKALEVKKER